MNLREMAYKAGRWAERIRWRVWNKHLLLFWHRLWIRRNEFHGSLRLDADALMVMNKKERGRYVKDLFRRRRIAHEADGP
ncbi:hypothetical protein KJ590_01145 [Patescibacteria group bacterium]|nr:hypothetical protein [Patescibacteria group bacterium]